MIHYIINGLVPFILILLIKSCRTATNVVETDLKSSFLLPDKLVCQDKASGLKDTIKRQNEWYRVLGALRNCEKGVLNNDDLGEFGKEILAQLSSTKEDEQIKQQTPQLWLGFLKYMDKHVETTAAEEYKDCDACVIWDTVFQGFDASGDNELDDIKRNLLIDLAIVMAKPPLTLVFANVQLTSKFRQFLRTITFSLGKEFSLTLPTKGKVESEPLVGPNDGSDEKIKGEVFQGSINSYKTFFRENYQAISEYPESAYLIDDHDRSIFIARLIDLATNGSVGISKLENYFNTLDFLFIFEKVIDITSADVSKVTLFLPDSRIVKNTQEKDYIITAYAKYIQLILSDATTTESDTYSNPIAEAKGLNEVFAVPTLNQRENLCRAYILPGLQKRLRILGSLPNHTNRLESLREYFANICMGYIDTDKIPEKVPFVDEKVLRSEKDNTILYLELLKKASSGLSSKNIGPVLEKLDSVEKVASFYDFIKADKILTGLNVIENLFDHNQDLFNKSTNTKGFRYLLRRILQSKAKEEFCGKYLLKLCGKEQGGCKGFIENSLRDLIIDNDELTSNNENEAQKLKGLVFDWNSSIRGMGECVVKAISNEQVECKEEKVFACKQNIIQFNFATTFLMIQKLGSSELQDHALSNLKSWISPNILEGSSFNHEIISKMIMAEVRNGSAGRIKELLHLAPRELKDTEGFVYAALATVHCENEPANLNTTLNFRGHFSMIIRGPVEARLNYSDLCANNRCTIATSAPRDNTAALELEEKIKKLDNNIQETSKEEDTSIELKEPDPKKEPAVGDLLAYLLAKAQMEYYIDETFHIRMTKYLHSLVRKIVIRDPDTLLENYARCIARYKATLKSSKNSMHTELVKELEEKKIKLDKGEGELSEEIKKLEEKLEKRRKLLQEFK